MDAISVQLTVLFEEPFWIGLCERWDGGGYEVSRVVFGAEPKDYELLTWLLREWYSLRFSPSVAAEAPAIRPANPKRMQRQARRALTRPTSTKAQQALAAAREEGKIQRKQRTRAMRDAEEARRLALRRDKAREKHKGH